MTYEEKKSQEKREEETMGLKEAFVYMGRDYAQMFNKMLMHQAEAKKLGEKLATMPLQP